MFDTIGRRDAEGLRMNRHIVRLAVCTMLLAASVQAHAQTDPLPSWNDGTAKQAIIAFVRATTTEGSPRAAFGNSIGDRQMLEYTKAGDGERLAMLVLHDDAKREYAYGPARGLPYTKVGTFTPALADEAKREGWIVISMKDDWKRIFAFEE